MQSQLPSRARGALSMREVPSTGDYGELSCTQLKKCLQISQANSLLSIRTIICKLILELNILNSKTKATLFFNIFLLTKAILENPFKILLQSTTKYNS